MPSLLPSRSWQWDLLLTRLPHDAAVFVLHVVSWLWTGEVVESLSDGPAGRWLLHRDGRISEIAVDAGAFGRTVFLDPRRAQELHARHPLALIAAAGTHSARFRFAVPGEAVADVLELPPAIEDCAL